MIYKKLEDRNDLWKSKSNEKIGMAQLMRRYRLKNLLPGMRKSFKALRRCWYVLIWLGNQNTNIIYIWCVCVGIYLPSIDAE